MKFRGNQRGFTLTELMVTVVVLGILSAIAIPNYTRYVAKGKRIDATTTLMEMAGKLESNYNMSYDYTKRKGGGAIFKVNDGPGVFGIEEPNDYEVRIASINKNAFLLKAVPKEAQKARDHNCQIFLIDNNGNKRAFDNVPGDLVAAMKDKDHNRSECW